MSRRPPVRPDQPPSSPADFESAGWRAAGAKPPHWPENGRRSSRRFLWGLSLTPHRYPPFAPRERPHWWPENEPWPPNRGRFGHNAFFRRLGCLFLAFTLFALLVFALLVLAVANTLGIIRFSDPGFPWNHPAAILILVPVAMVVIIAAAAAFGVRRISTPLDELLVAAERVAEQDYSVRVVERGPRSIRSLAGAFNNMASRLHLADQQRRNLLADVTHELRTPLTVIQGNLEGMLDGVYEPDETNLRSLLDETHILSRLVEDLRTLALAESGALQLRKEPTDMAMLIEDTRAAFQAQADLLGVMLVLDVAPDLPALDIDPGRMRQVLSNLVSNALHYTPAGGSIWIRSKVDGDRQLLLEVQDSGLGIPVEDLPHVFERFYKSADSGGMGLGLAIAKHLVSAHGGQIEAQSHPSEGTTFRIHLPLISTGND